MKSRIIAALRPVLRRIRRQHYLSWLLRGLAAGLLLFALFLLFSFFLPWPGVKQLGPYTLGASIFLATGWAFLLRPDLWTAAAMSDAKGLRERITTALEFSARDSEILRRQRQDTLEQLQDFDYKSAFPYVLPPREGKLIAAGILLVALLCLIPNPQQAEADKLIAVKQEIMRQEKKIETLKKEIQAKSASIPLKELEKTVSALEKLQKDLHEAGDIKNALKSLAQAEETLEKLKLEGLRQGRPDTASPAAVLPGPERPAVLDEDAEDRNKGQEGPNTSGDEGRDSPSEDGDNDKSYGADNKADPSISESGHSSGSQSVAEENAAYAEGRAAALGELNRAMRTIQDSRQALLAATASPSSMAGVTGGDSNTAPDSYGNSPAGSGGTVSSASSAGEQGTGNSGGPGGQGQQGNTTGSGAGAGLGSGSGDNPAMGQTPSPSDSGAGELAMMKWGEYEKIYDPQHIGRSGEISQLRGQAGEGPQQLVETDDPALMTESMRPYREVLGDYSQAARESLQRQPIPSGMVEVVRNYFSSLEE